MPIETIRGEPFNVQLDGPDDAPVLMLSNSLGTNLSMWDPQVAEWSRSFRCCAMICADMVARRRQTAPARLRSSPTMRWPSSITSASRAHIGADCQRAAWSANGSPRMPERASTVLVSANTSAHMGPPELWEGRIKTVTAAGMAPLVKSTLERWFSKPFRERDTATVAKVSAMLETTHLLGYAGCCAAIRDMDQREAIRGIADRVLVIVGAVDPLIACGRPAHRRYHQGSAAHRARCRASLESGAASRIRSRGARFPQSLKEPSWTRKPVTKMAWLIRRAVLGPAYVDKAVVGVTPFNGEFQEFITRTAWNDIWNRPGLARRERSIIVISIAAALSAWGEFRIHIQVLQWC